MKEFMFFIRKQSDSREALTPDKFEQFLKSCETYIEKLKKEGRLISAQPIEREGVIISGIKEFRKAVPFNETNEIIGGYYHVLAIDIDEAVEIAGRNPEFEYNRDTRIEVRPVKTKEDTTGFVYPAK